MRKLWATLAGIAGALLLPIMAAAECVGADLLPGLRDKDPVAVEAMYARAAAVPNGKGRFWMIERGDETPSYLLGSFHAAQALNMLTPRMLAAFTDANTVVVEVDLDQQAAMEARMTTDPAFSFDLTGPGFSSRLTPEQRVHVSAALAARGMRLEDVDQMQPWLIASLLSFPACHLRTMAAGEQPMDTALAERALATDRPVLGLEGYEEAIAAFRRIEPEVLIESIASTGEMAVQDEDLFRTNLKLYGEGEIALIPELAILLGEQVAPDVDHRQLNDRVMVEILDVRNRAWMPALLEALAPGGTFVIVGALHLPGEAGLVELLRAEGYRITRLDR